MHMNKRTVKNFNANNISDDMILAEMICNDKEINPLFLRKEIVNDDIDSLIFGEIDVDRLYHSEK